MPPKALNRLIELIFTIRHLVLEHAMKSHAPCLSLPQLETLHFLAELPQATMREIAIHFGVTPPSATSIINNLVRDGLLKRMSDPKDRRMIRVMITPKGQALLDKEMQKIILRMKRIFGKLSVKDQESLAEILYKLAKVYNH